MLDTNTVFFSFNVMTWLGYSLKLMKVGQSNFFEAAGRNVRLSAKIDLYNKGNAPKVCSMLK